MSGQNIIPNTGRVKIIILNFWQPRKRSFSCMPKFLPSSLEPYILLFTVVFLPAFWFSPHLDPCHGLVCLGLFIYIKQQIPFKSVRNVAGNAPLNLLRGQNFTKGRDGRMFCAAVTRPCLDYKRGSSFAFLNFSIFDSSMVKGQAKRYPALNLKFIISQDCLFPIFSGPDQPY